MTTSTPAPDFDLMAAFLMGSLQTRSGIATELHEELVCMVRKHPLRRIGVRSARDRANSLDLNEDIVQQIWERIFSNPTAVYDPECQSPRSYLAGYVANSARKVLATYTPPREQTRFNPKPSPQPDTSDSTAPSNYTPVVYLSALALEGADGEDCLRAAVDDIGDAEDRVYVEQVLAVADALLEPRACKALRLIWAEDYTLGEAAQAVGLSRFALRRRLDVLKAHPVLCAA